MDLKLVILRENIKNILVREDVMDLVIDLLRKREIENEKDYWCSISQTLNRIESSRVLADKILEHLDSDDLEE